MSDKLRTQLQDLVEHISPQEQDYLAEFVLPPLKIALKDVSPRAGPDSSRLSPKRATPNISKVTFVPKTPRRQRPRLPISQATRVAPLMQNRNLA